MGIIMRYKYRKWKVKSRLTPAYIFCSHNNPLRLLPLDYDMPPLTLNRKSILTEYNTIQEYIDHMRWCIGEARGGAQITPRRGKAVEKQLGPWLAFRDPTEALGYLWELHDSLALSQGDFLDAYMERRVSILSSTLIDFTTVLGDIIYGEKSN